MTIIKKKLSFDDVLAAVKSRRVKWGPLIVLLFCLNGGIALFYGMLHNRLVDSRAFFVIFAVASSVGLIFYWISRAIAPNGALLRSSLGGVAKAARIGNKASHGDSDRKRNKKRDKKKKHRK